MQKNESYVSPFLPLIIFALLSLCNGIAQVAADGSNADHVIFILKTIEYGIGISAAVALVFGGIVSIANRNVLYILATIIVILLINLIMPFLVKYIFVLIIACVIMIAAMFFMGPVALWVFAIFASAGVLGPIIAVAFFAATIISGFLVGGW